MGIRFAVGQITWNQFKMTDEQFLADTAQAGFEGAPPSRGRTAPEAAEMIAKYGLKPAPRGLPTTVPYWMSAEERAEFLQKTAETAKYCRELGLTEVFVIPALTPERRALAGHVRREDAIPQADFQKLAGLLNEIGNITLKEGVRACVHNHCGSHIETRWEIDQLFELVDRSVVFQGADIGHLAWAGDDVLQFAKDYADSIKALHIKDIYPKVLAEGVAKSWDYKTFSDHGIFAELGEGLVDYKAFFQIMEQVGYDGWVVVETDRTTKATPLESATISRNYLKSIGY